MIIKIEIRDKPDKKYRHGFHSLVNNCKYYVSMEGWQKMTDYFSVYFPIFENEIGDEIEFDMVGIR